MINVSNNSYKGCKRHHHSQFFFFFFKWLSSASATVQLAATHLPVAFLREGLSIQFREGQSRHKCKHISVIIEAGTHKAKYRAVMQSIMWL